MLTWERDLFRPDVRVEEVVSRLPYLDKLALGAPPVVDYSISINTCPL